MSSSSSKGRLGSVCLCRCTDPATGDTNTESPGPFVALWKPFRRRTNHTVQSCEPRLRRDRLLNSPSLVYSGRFSLVNPAY
jgi:hypothetical protein